MRISDLGLAVEIPEGEMVRGRVGTVGYMGKLFIFIKVELWPCMSSTRNAVVLGFFFLNV